ncbi:MAG: hypothetical protein ACK6AT_12000 [Planctomycetota bacterium]
MSARSEEASPKRIKKQLIKNDSHSSRDVRATAACHKPAICSIAKATSSVASPDEPNAPTRMHRDNHGVKTTTNPIPQTHAFETFLCSEKIDHRNEGSKPTEPNSTNRQEFQFQTRATSDPMCLSSAAWKCTK